MSDREAPSGSQERLKKTADAAGESEFISISEVLAFLRAHATAILLPTILAIILALVYILTTKPVYTAQAQVLIDPSGSRISESTATAQRISLDAAQVASEIAVLQSETIAAMVVKELKLTEDPEFKGKKPSLFRRLVGLLKPGGKGEASRFIRERVAIGILRSNLDIRRSGLSYAINISYSSYSPEKSARIANAIIRAYIADQLQNRTMAARDTSHRLLVRIHRLRQLFNKAAEALKNFKAGHVVSLPELPRESETPDQKGRGAVTLEILMATVEAYRKMYENSYAAYSEAVQREAFPFSDARTLTVAMRPLGKSHPRSVLTLLLAMLGGLLVGLAIAFLRDNLDGTVRSSRQITTVTGLPCLVQIPDAEMWNRPATIWGSPLQFFSELFNSSEQKRLVPLRLFQTVTREPFSQFAGAIKVLKSVIFRADSVKTNRIVGITSSSPGEGKSMVVANLAATLSKSSLSLLVIDADIHNPALSQVFAPASTNGLLEVLKGEAKLNDAIYFSKAGNFSILPALKPANEAISYDLLGDRHMVKMLAELRLVYDIILVDMPALTPVADSFAICTLLDDILLATALHETSVDLLAEVTRGLKVVDANVLGLVLTKTENTQPSVWFKNSKQF